MSSQISGQPKFGTPSSHSYSGNFQKQKVNSKISQIDDPFKENKAGHMADRDAYVSYLENQLKQLQNKGGNIDQSDANKKILEVLFH